MATAHGWIEGSISSLPLLPLGSPEARIHPMLRISDEIKAPEVSVYYWTFKRGGGVSLLCAEGYLHESPCDSLTQEDLDRLISEKPDDSARRPRWGAAYQVGPEAVIGIRAYNRSLTPEQRQELDVLDDISVDFWVARALADPKHQETAEVALAHGNVIATRGNVRCGPICAAMLGGRA